MSPRECSHQPPLTRLCSGRTTGLLWAVPSSLFLLPCCLETPHWRHEHQFQVMEDPPASWHQHRESGARREGPGPPTLTGGPARPERRGRAGWPGPRCPVGSRHTPCEHFLGATRPPDVSEIWSRSDRQIGDLCCQQLLQDLMWAPRGRPPGRHPHLGLRHSLGGLANDRVADSP